MVWPFNKRNDEHSQNYDNPGENQYETKSFYRSYSTSKSCKQDPEDSNYMICKEIINDGNNTTEK